MKFTDIFIKRPVMASAISLFILLLGFFAIFQLPLRLFPKITTPVISIETTYPGANAEVIAATITSVIDNAIVGIENIDYIKAQSTQGNSEIAVHLHAGANINNALVDITGKVSAIQGRLPKAANKPVISKFERNRNPTVMLAFTSDKMSDPQIGNYLRQVIKPKIEAINGVAKANVMGGQYAMHIWLNPHQLAAYQLSPEDVAQALMEQNIQAAPGATKGHYVGFTIYTSTNLTTPQQFDQLVIKNNNGQLVRLQDVGYAKLDNETDIYSAYFNGKRANALFIQPLPSANPLRLARSVNQQLPTIAQTLPYDMKLHVVVSAASYIRASINEVLISMMEAVIIVVAVIFLSLGALRSVIIPVVTIPLSLIGVCFYMLLMGYSINMLTLLAMVLAIGLVVDDAIVVVENIFRYIEQGMQPTTAALRGTRELATPIIAMTITLAAVFAPIGFMGGVSGQLFSEFALTLAGAVIISGVIALVLSPMMCSKLLSSAIAEQKMVKLADRGFNIVKTLYRRALVKSLQCRKTIITLWLIIIASVFLLYAYTPKELSPKEDYSFLIAIGDAPDNTNSGYLQLYSRELNKVFGQIPQIKNYMYVNGYGSSDGNSVMAFIQLVDWKQRQLSSMQLQPILQQKLNNIAGLKFMSVVPSVLPGNDSNTGVAFVLTSTGSYQSLATVTQKLQQLAQQSGLFMYLDHDLTFNQPQLQLMINRNAAAILGVPMNHIATSLALMLSNNNIQQFTMYGRSYDVITQLPQHFRLNPSQLGDIYVTTKSGKLVPLSSIVTMKITLQPSSLNQFQKLNAVTISGIMMPGHSLSQGLSFLKTQAKKILPKGMSYDFTGSSRRFLQEGNRILKTFGLAFVVIFLVLAIQFESYRDPFIILLGSVPMSLFGALLFLKLGFSTINIYTQLGLLTLIGLVSKHGILMTKFANDLQDSDNVSVTNAIINAAEIRFRPIIMTTTAMVCSTIPLMMVEGAGSASRFAIGIVIATGLLIGTLFTLFVVPTLYVLLARNRVTLKELKRQKELL